MTTLHGPSAYFPLEFRATPPKRGNVKRARTTRDTSGKNSGRRTVSSSSAAAARRASGPAVSGERMMTRAAVRACASGSRSAARMEDVDEVESDKRKGKRRKLSSAEPDEREAGRVKSEDVEGLGGALGELAIVSPPGGQNP
ncbi:hypothetical protein BT69DRAFT_270531 [Atractiella rhizophila]|nr:hypothetical protein BT69DRAFT_270531 [Atractiella rhizophila]